MLEFVFKKSALTKLIEESADPTEGDVVVRLSFEPKVNGKFPALVTAHCEGGTGKALAESGDGDEQIDGCPRPPGCD